MIQTLMNTHEVAEYLRIKERKVYDLVAQQQIPCTRAAGKWLFPKELIDQWLLQQAVGPGEPLSPPEPPHILSGSHDPLLDWAVRESGCGLAVLFNGSMDGFDHFLNHRSLACGIHVIDRDSGEYNLALLEPRLARKPVVAIEWAQREQGLIVAPGNPFNIRQITDILDKPFAMRQKEAGSYLLLDYLLQQEGCSIDDLSGAGKSLRSETEVALAVANDSAVAGLGIAAVAHQFGLTFIPLAHERYDLVMQRRQYFAPPMQSLLALTRQPAFAQRAQELGGYDISSLGSVRYNAAV